MWKHETPRIAKAISEETTTERITILSNKMCHGAVGTRAVGAGAEAGARVNDRDGRPRNTLLIVRGLFTGEAETTQRESVSATNGVGKPGQLHAKEPKWAALLRHAQR